MIRSFEILILSTLASSIISVLIPQQNTVIGMYRDKKFEDYELDLWTFIVKNNSVINSTQFSIASRRHEAVKALEINYHPSVEYLPVNVSENFPNLAIFEAQNNSIKSISRDNFNGLKKLVKLLIDSNKISEISAETFNDLVRLKTLSLTYNLIHTIHGDGFKNLHTLQTLYLGHNNLKYLPKNVFESLENLKNLSLNYNHLTFLGDEHLMYNEKLEYIWLEHNDMSHLSYTMFNYMNNLKYIDFSFNLHMWSGFVYEKNGEF